MAVFFLPPLSDSLELESESSRVSTEVGFFFILEAAFFLSLGPKRLGGVRCFGSLSVLDGWREGKAALEAVAFSGFLERVSLEGPALVEASEL